MNPIYFLFLAFVALMIADYETTKAALTSGAGREANPLMSSLITRFGFNGLIAVKFVIAVFVFYAVRHGQLSSVVLGGLDLFYGAVVLHNYLIVRKAVG